MSTESLAVHTPQAQTDPASPIQAYRAERRGGEAAVNVTLVDAQGREYARNPLPLRLDLANHSPGGFEWGYRGSGPAQLALALLAHGAGDDVFALARHQEFKEDVIAHLPDEGWLVYNGQVQEWAAKRELSAEDREMATPMWLFDKETAETTPCHSCGGKCGYRAVREPGSYRAFADCRRCGRSVEF